MVQFRSPPSGTPSLVSRFIRHPNAANLLMVLLLLFGAFALARINTQFFPSVEQPNISVSIAWSGASAEDVEAGILQIVEPQVRFLNDLKEIRSIAREGSASIQLEFVESADMQQAVADVEAALQAITNLPEDAETPRISRSQWFESVATLSISGDVPETTLRLWAKRIRDELINAGIDKVDLNGMRDEQLRVEVSEADLRRFGLTIGDVSRAIARASRDIPSGDLRGGVERQLRIVADAESVEALRTVEIRALATGERILLEDIATIERVFDPDAVQGLSDGLRAIEIEVRRAPTADTLQTAGIFRDYVEELETRIPPDIALNVYDVRADALSDRIMLLVKNGLGGLIVVIAILFIFLDVRVAFWVAAGIPVAMMATMGVMFMLDQSVNMISLFGLIMMLGIIVDDAIVVGEHTATRLENGDPPEVAAENGVGMMLVPVMAAMGTTLAAFFPMMLISGTIGQIMGVLPYVAISVVIASLIECFFILPAHLAHSLDGRSARPRWSHWRHGVFALLVLAGAVATERFLSAFATGGALAEWLALYNTQSVWLRALIVAALAYLVAALVEGLILFMRRRAARRDETALREGRGPRGPRAAFDKGFGWFRDGPFLWLAHRAFEWRYAVVAISIASMMVIGMALVQGDRVRFVFFPSPEAERISGSLTMQAGMPREVVEDAVRRIEGTLRQVEAQLGEGAPLIAAVYTTIGSSGRNSGSNLARIQVQLVPTEARDVRTGDFVRAWRNAVPDIPGVRRFSVIEQRGGPPGRDVDITLEGGSSPVLKRAAGEVAEFLTLVPGVSGVTDDLPYGRPELIMTLTPRGASLGFDLEEVGQQVRNALEGAVARRFARGDDEIEIRVMRQTPPLGTSALQRLELRSPEGVYIPLSEIVDIEEKQGFAVIERVDGKTRIAVTGDLDSSVNTTDGVIEQLNESGFLEEISARYGIDYSFGGRAQEQREAFADVGLGTIIAMSVIYIILAWVFGSYTRPFAVMLIIPFGYVGAVFGHWWMGFDLTILSLIGLLGLSGILVNDSIILVSRYDTLIAEGNSIPDAAAGASRDRLRAVLLTSLTTIGGLLPLLYETSLQAQFLLPMAITIVYGLALATFLVLFLVPALIGIGWDIRRGLAAVFGGAERSGTAPAE